MKIFKVKGDHTWRKAFGAAFLIWIVALGFRCCDYAATPIYTDERLWIERATKVLVKLETNPTSATTHLGQPGIPPTLVIAFGQWAAKRWNRSFDLTHGDPLFVGTVDAGRIPIIVLTSFIAPLLFLLTFEVVGVGVAFVAALGLGLDPYLTACSRMIHLDALLALFVLCTIGLYHFAVLRSSLRLKLSAGAMWGVAIATKPTAVILIPCFLLYKALREYLQRRGLSVPGERGLFSWSDVGAVAVGHVVFAMLYTRLWVHRSEYLTRLQIRNPLAGEIFSAGRWLQTNSFVAVIILVGLILLFAFSTRMLVKRWSRGRYHGVCAMFALLCAFLAVLMVPQVLENFTRYWTWVFNLSHEPYRAFVSNITVNVHPHGYHELAFMHLPTIVTLFAIAGVIGVARPGFWRSCPPQFVPLLGVMVVLPVLWGALLGSADKQSWRYAMPVLFGVYLLAGIGAVSLVARLVPHARTGWVVGSVFVLWVACLAATSSPYGLFFRSSISGGLAGHVARGYGLEHFVSPELESELLSGVEPRGELLRVMVFGDVPLQTLGLKRFAPRWKERVIFSGPGMSAPHRVLGYAPFLQRMDAYPGDTRTVLVDGVPLAGIKILSKTPLILHSEQSRE